MCLPYYTKCWLSYELEHMGLYKNRLSVPSRPLPSARWLWHELGIQLLLALKLEAKHFKCLQFKVPWTFVILAVTSWFIRFLNSDFKFSKTSLLGAGEALHVIEFFYVNRALVSPGCPVFKILLGS